MEVWEVRRPDVLAELPVQVVCQDPEPRSGKKNNGGTAISSKTVLKVLPK